VLGSPAARVAGAALGTVALVLEPANGPNALGYEAEKNFSNRHPTLPPDSTAFHPAELEQIFIAIPILYHLLHHHLAAYIS
jgi:hypothetical protein